MSFYKLDNETLLIGPNYVYGPNYTLLKENYSDYQYPVEGWYWFDTDEEAYAFFNYTPPVIE